MELKLLSDDILSERWHNSEHAGDNDGSWHYRLKSLRKLAQAEQKNTLRQVIEWGKERCPHKSPKTKDRIYGRWNCATCWQELQNLMEEK